MERTVQNLLDKHSPALVVYCRSLLGEAGIQGFDLDLAAFFLCKHIAEVIDFEADPSSDSDDHEALDKFLARRTGPTNLAEHENWTRTPFFVRQRSGPTLHGLPERRLTECARTWSQTQRSLAMRGFITS